MASFPTLEYRIIGEFGIMGGGGGGGAHKNFFGTNIIKEEQNAFIYLRLTSFL